ncbi:MAG TPA: hypothetical protein VKT78_13765 [Fimbriimonadaceae bacterium]|nr:hypothetical protein [Fimbriimonadaceae bacterium]
MQAMVSISPDRFWALAASLLDDGYLPTENILVLKTDPTAGTLTVKEGNRRIAALKLIHGIHKSDDLVIPESTLARIKCTNAEWKKNNQTVPCTIYPPEDAAIVDRIVTLAHGKGEKAGRDQWNAVARARHNRDFNLGSEPALDQLEKYLASGKNLTAQQKERWAGDYPLTVLEEAMKRLALRLGSANAPELARKYPAIDRRHEYEEVLRDIGQKLLGFEAIRKQGADFAIAYGIPQVRSSAAGAAPGSAPASSTANADAAPGSVTGGDQANPNAPATSGKTRPGTSQAPGAPGARTAAHAINDPRAVTKALKQFVPKGNGRQKMVTLRDEALKLKLRDNPLAFCFLLRSMFEISAKLYAADHQIRATKPDGKDKTLADLLRDNTRHLTGGNRSSPMGKVLHGAQTELARPDGILSVTSMNQLVHSTTFSVQPQDISTLFGNIYPLLEAMN